MSKRKEGEGKGKGRDGAISGRQQVPERHKKWRSRKSGKAREERRHTGCSQIREYLKEDEDQEVCKLVATTDREACMGPIWGKNLRGALEEGKLEGAGRDLNSEPEAQSSIERRKKPGRGGP